MNDISLLCDNVTFEKSNVCICPMFLIIYCFSSVEKEGEHDTMDE